MSSRVVVPDLNRIALWLSPSTIARVIIALAQQAQADGDAVQAGSGVLREGVAEIDGVRLTPSSVVAVFRSTPRGALGAGGLVAPVESRSIAAGSFVVHAVDLAGAVVTTESSSFEFVIFDPAETAAPVDIVTG
jgi:hypothetical protein